MASRRRKSGSGGRVTPNGGAARPRDSSAANAKAPPRRGPIDREKPVTIGRRPSSPGFLAIVAIMWMAVGVIIFLTFSTSWKLVPAIVAFGIGILFLRGAGSTVLRRERRRSSGS